MTLLICPVRPGDKNEELRYALRSWEANLAGSHDLLVVGHCPPWLKPDYFQSGNQYRSAPLAVWDNIITATKAAVLMNFPEAIYMNDDFFAMRPVPKVHPVKRNITLAQHIAMFPDPGSGWWAQSLALTASLLAGEGYPHPDSYEVHRPLLAQPAAMLSALSKWRGGTQDGVPQWRTLYGVLNEIEAEPVADAKLGLRGADPHSPWTSTTDHSWPRYAHTIRTRFQKPSRWEQPD
jgi:hypothetical protein